MSFVPNNIRFRSVSSKALSLFYEGKAFILNDLLMEKNQFSEVARETLLLLFNSYTSWAQRVEYMFLNNPIVKESDVDTIIADERKMQSYHLEIFELYPHIFNDKFIEPWYAVNSHSRKAFRALIRSTEGMPTLEAFPILVSGLGNMLQNCLFELYEVDCLLGSDFVQLQCSTNRSNADRMVVYITNFAINYYFQTGVFMCEERVKYYKSIACGRLPVMVKNYSSSKLSFAGVIEGDEPLASLLQRCTEHVDIIDIVSCPPAK